ncbi:diflavin oxidoreductase [Terrihabitans sp. B22-R8]|uniref:diflavin oxidoreductase n=1 Tax=Terrihabitans sp. B22-R8 TaxID=3425128 RepID=UPI00403C0471
MTDRPIPSTAPFSEEDISLLNRVIAPSSPVQRAWLAGFLAGLDAGAGGAQQPAPARSSKPAEPLTIVFATESGNCEKLAADTAKAARKSGFKPTIIDMADLTPEDLTKAKKLLVIAATWGEGDPPARAVHAYEMLMSDAAPRIEGTQFGVLALGDTAYVDFCAIGRNLDERLEALGGTRIADRVDCDLDFAGPAAGWIEASLEKIAPAGAADAGHVIEVDFGARQAVASEAPISAEVVEHINLNSSRSDKETFHVAFGFEEPLPYEPGDALDIYPVNDPALADEILAATGHAGNGVLRDELIRDRDITTLSLKTLEKFVAATGDADIKALIDGNHARNWIAGRQLVDLVTAHPVPLSVEQVYDITRPLAPRAYSIASSRKEFEDEVHVLVAAVRYEAHGRARAGVASSYIADRLKRGSEVRVKLKPNKHFRLPEPDRDIIMVGPGTGVAPFRAFAQERRAIAAQGRNWLFFGDRRYTHDFLYQLDWQDLANDGYLHRIDVAFSRDQPHKVYVQDRLWARRHDLVDWLDGGAKFYVCGDAKNMAKDVRATLVKAFADVKALTPDAAEASVRALETEKRYLSDVY